MTDTIFAVAIEESLHHPECLGRVLVARDEPAGHVMVWARGLKLPDLSDIPPRWQVLVTATTHGWPGFYDWDWHIGSTPAHHAYRERLRIFARSLPRDTIVRLDPEPNSKLQRAHWQQVEPKVYREGFDRMARVIHEERPDVRVAVCLAYSGWSFDPDLRDYLPSEADIVGFDVYERDRAARSPSKRIRNISWAVRKRADKPRWVFETAIDRSLKKQAGGQGKRAWMRDLLSTDSVEGVCLMDFDPPEEVAAGMDVRWAMTNGMRKEWRRALR